MKKFLIVLAAVVSSACGSLPKSAPPVVVYDFGPPAERLAPDRAWSSLALEVKSPPWFDSLNIDYRLAYENPLKPREYAGSRWAGTPQMLLAQRLRQQLGTASGAGNAAAGCLVKLELQEFSQIFDSPQQSRGVVKGSVSLIDAKRNLAAEWQVSVEKPAASADAPGGVHALVASSSTLGEQVHEWLLRLDKDGTLKRCKPSS